MFYLPLSHRGWIHHSNLKSQFISGCLMSASRDNNISTFSEINENTFATTKQAIAMNIANIAVDNSVWSIDFPIHWTVYLTLPFEILCIPFYANTFVVWPNSICNFLVYYSIPQIGICIIHLTHMSIAYNIHIIYDTLLDALIEPSSSWIRLLHRHQANIVMLFVLNLALERKYCIMWRYDVFYFS